MFNGLLDKLKQLQGPVNSLVYGQANPNDENASLTPSDVATLQEGPQENRGLHNILQNISLLGARRRGAAEQLRESEQERQAKLDLMKAQAENYRSLGPYRQGLLDIRAEANKIRALHEEVYKSRSEQEFKAALGRLEVAQRNAATEEKNAETRSQQVTNEYEAAQARQDLEKARLAHQIADDAVKNSISWGQLKVAQGWESQGEAKLSGQIRETSTQADLNAANTANVQQRTEQSIQDQPLETATKGLNAIAAGQKTNMLTPEGSRGLFSSTVTPNTGIPPRGPSLFERATKFLRPDQNFESGLPKPAPTAPTPTKPATVPTQKIRVRRKTDGMTGRIDAADFDPTLYEKISG